MGNFNYYFKQPLIFRWVKGQNSLDTAMSLRTTEAYSQLEFMTVFNKFGYLVYSESEIIDEVAYSSFSFVDLNKLQRRTTRIKEGIMSEANLFVLNKDSIYYCLQLMETKNSKGYAKDLRTKDFEPKDYNYAYVQGGVGSPIINIDFLYLYREPTNNLALHISQGYGLKIGPYFTMQPPEGLCDEKPSPLQSVRVNDDNCLIIRWGSTPKSNKGLGTTTYLVFDKKRNSWYKKVFMGNNVRIRSYENSWLAGTIIELDASNEKNPASGSNHSYKRVAPGYEERDPILYDWPIGIWGDCFDERAINMNMYFPGLLFLFNVHTKEYIEWDTQQGDSEILLVQDNIVYYRVNTKIFRSSILNNATLGLPELLIDDVRVRDIHWAHIPGRMNN